MGELHGDHRGREPVSAATAVKPGVVNGSWLEFMVGLMIGVMVSLMAHGCASLMVHG